MHFIFDNVPKSNSFNIGSNASNVSKKKSSIKSGAFRKKHVIRFRTGKREKLKLFDFGALIMPHYRKLHKGLTASTIPK